MKKLISLFTVCLLVFACSKPDTTIALNKVGAITNHTTIQDLATLFKNDSIVSRYSEGDLGNINDYVLDNDTHLIYAKGGELLLSISPVNPLDSVSKIKSVTVFSEAYQTKEEVGVASTFNDVNVNHTIEKLEASFKSVTVFVKDINATFTMDKQELGIKTFTLGIVDKAQIPGDAKFTSLTIWLEE
ncbi:hypothetical protein [Wenyingzhuangia aestuarii]|uniref:hypothetical protein n=1 Tax=Wenyingzhuangia aestuarii TaxID=1647582 RepID=UPI0014396A99|nr:hypothetical protein [Wenyingzhuangia aestuarii]NJB83836.1 hypothetical protein [Wenyingzhuangia aestuarii]